MKIGFLALVALVAASVAVPLDNSEEVQARFDNYKVVRLTPTNKQQIEMLHEMEKSADGFNFWKSASQVGRPVDIMIPPHKLPEANKIFASLGLDYEEMVEDVQN